MRALCEVSFLFWRNFLCTHFCFFFKGWGGGGVDVWVFWWVWDRDNNKIAMTVAIILFISQSAHHPSAFTYIKRGGVRIHGLFVESKNKLIKNRIETAVCLLRYSSKESFSTIESETEIELFYVHKVVCRYFPMCSIVE